MDSRQQLLLRICAPILSQHASRYCINSTKVGKVGTYSTCNQHLGLSIKSAFMHQVFRAPQRPEILHVNVNIAGTSSTRRHLLYYGVPIPLTTNTSTSAS